jgi:hypothetical protein
MDKEITCKTGLSAGLINEETFGRELDMCKKLSRKKEGKCNWGECAKCGVVPLLYKLHKGELYEKEEEVKVLKENIFRNED